MWAVPHDPQETKKLGAIKNEPPRYLFRAVKISSGRLTGWTGFSPPPRVPQHGFARRGCSSVLSDHFTRARMLRFYFRLTDDPPAKKNLNNLGNLTIRIHPDGQIFSKGLRSGGSGSSQMVNPLVQRVLGVHILRQCAYSNQVAGVECAALVLPPPQSHSDGALPGGQTAQ